MDSDEALTVWVGNLPSQVDEELLYELFLQVAPLKRVRIPQDKSGKYQSNYGFITFQHACSLQYAVDMFNDTQLYDRIIYVRHRNPRNTNPLPAPTPPLPQVQNVQNGLGMLGMCMLPLIQIPAVPMLPIQPPPQQHNYQGRDRSRHGQSKVSNEKPYVQHKSSHRSSSRSKHYSNRH